MACGSPRPPRVGTESLSPSGLVAVDARLVEPAQEARGTLPPELRSKGADLPRVDEASVLARIPALNGPVPGVAGLSVVRTLDPSYCGGVRVEVLVTERVVGDARMFVEAYAVRLPVGLAIDPVHAADASSLSAEAELDSAVRGARSRVVSAMSAYGSESTTDLAFRILLLRRLVELVVRSEIPPLVRQLNSNTGSWCDGMRWRVAFLLEEVDDLVRRCQEVGRRDGTGDGWWSQVCR
jgi:hypothetical protein